MSKRNIKVVSSDGVAWATRKGADKIVTRGLARQIDPSSIRMIEVDPRFMGESHSAGGRPALQVIHTAPEPDPIQDSGLNCFALQWPLSMRYQGSTRSRKVAA